MEQPERDGTDPCPTKRGSIRVCPLFPFFAPFPKIIPEPSSSEGVFPLSPPMESVMEVLRFMCQCGGLIWGLSPFPSHTVENRGETCFHCVEKCPKHASMVWKTGESGFHGVEKRRIRLPWHGTFCGARRNDDSHDPPSRFRRVLQLLQKIRWRGGAEVW